MLELISGNSFLVLTVLIFVAIVLLLEAAYLTWKSYKGADAKKIEKRLQALSAASDSSQQAHILKQRLLSEVPRIEQLLLSLPRIERLDKFILQAGLQWTVSRLLLSSLALGVAGGFALMSLAHQSLLVSAWVGAGCAALPWLHVARRRESRLKKFEQQLPDALDLMTRALRAGHAFATALQMVGDEMAEPVANEFRIVHDEVNFGVALEQALTNLTTRIPSTDLRYFVVAVLIQREAGGNLTEVLGNLSRLIRERLKLLARVRVMSSEGRLSAWILGLLPFGLAALMSVVNPDFMTPLWTDPIGISIVKFMLGLTVIGVVLLRKIIRIRV